MKKIIPLYLLGILLIKCSKENPPGTNSEIKDVTGVSWQLFSLQNTNDPFINPIPSPWYLRLNNDRSYSFSLQNSTSTGTYSWTQLDSVNAKVNFTIQSWNSAVVDTQYTNKLKTILQSVDSCHYLKYPYLLPIPIFSDPPKMQLQFHGSAGHFYVFTF